MKQLGIYILFLLVGISAAYADDTRTQIFDPNFKTLQVKLEGNDYFPPIIVLGSDDRIRISFDDLQEDLSYLRYSLVHCNADWQPSDLLESEYVNGFNYANIENYKFSTATFCHYVHYSFAIPNENMQILKSGNYLVKVYPENEPENVVLQARFSVSENAVSVGTSVSSRTDIDYNQSHQQLKIDVSTRNYKVQDMYRDLKLIVSQNGRNDNEVMITSPMMVGMNKATYDHNKDLIFPAANEFRRIETVSERTMSMGVVDIEFHEPYYHARLRTDEVRANEPYSYDQTQLGRFTVRSADVDDSDNQADYYVTHFTLNTGGKIEGGNIYIDGEFTNHLFTPANLMKYDASTGCYINDMLLKQGAYNYQYLFVPNGSTKGLTSVIEGDKYQTVNEYVVEVYNRQPSERYDRFIGFGIVYSGK